MKNLGVNGVQPIFLLTVGAVTGGIAGYMISELVIDRLLYGHVESGEDDEENSDGPAVMEMKKEDIEKINYGKKPLSELVRPYESESKEAIRIVDFDEVVGNDVELIHYYDEDTTFCYGSGDLIDDPNSLFVPNVHLHFASSESDIVYVRNDDVGLYYEIVRLLGSYKEEVLGEIPEEKKPKKTPVKRSRRAATKPKPKKDPVEELTDDPHPTDGK